MADFRINSNCLLFPYELVFSFLPQFSISILAGRHAGRSSAGRLHLSAKEKQSQHVEQNVAHAGVGEHVGKRLPNVAVPENRHGVHRKEKERLGSYLIDEIHKNIDADEDERGVEIAIRKRFADQ